MISTTVDSRDRLLISGSDNGLVINMWSLTSGHLINNIVLQHSPASAQDDTADSPGVVIAHADALGGVFGHPAVVAVAHGDEFIVYRITL